VNIFSRLKQLTGQAWTAQQFWDWFQSKEGQKVLFKFKRGPSADTSAASTAVGNALMKVHKDLVWSLTPVGEDGTGGEFEVSAGGLRALIPVVEELVAAAPQMAAWEVFAFKQPIEGFCLTTSDDDEGIDASNVMVAASETQGGVYDVDVYLPTPAGTLQNTINELGFIVLDHALGEYIVMTRLHRVNFHSTLIAPPGLISVEEFSTRFYERSGD